MAEITVIECAPHAGGTANCAFCRAVIDLTFPHYAVHSPPVTFGFCICLGCTSQAVIAALSDEWPDIITRAFRS